MTREALLAVSRIALPALLALGVASGVGAEPKKGLPPKVPRPDFMRNKPFIPDFLLEHKREGRYVTGIPAIGWDAEQGVTIGGNAEFYDNGSRDDPFFRTAPYRRKLLIGGIVTSEGVIRLLGRLDIPYIADTPYRFRVDALFERSDIANYFGVGKDGRELVSPRTGNEYRKYSRYENDLEVRVPGGSDSCPPGEPACSYSRYNSYRSSDVFGVISIERDLLGGLVRPLVGFQIRHADIGDFTGERVKSPAGGKKAFQLQTKLLRDCLAGIAHDCSGGWDNFVKLGLAYDSRDFEPDPRNGVLAEMVAELSSRAFGAERDYQRLTFSAAYFRDLLAGRSTTQQLVLAARAVYNAQFGTVPVFALPQMGFSANDRRGLGGFSSLRGFKRNRFVGESAASLQGELRWYFTEWMLWNQHLKPGLAGFVDSGRAFDGVTLRLDDWQVGGGAGLRLAWNLATLISFDVAFSREENVFYVELGTAF